MVIEIKPVFFFFLSFFFAFLIFLGFFSFFGFVDRFVFARCPSLREESSSKEEFRWIVVRGEEVA